MSKLTLTLLLVTGLAVEASGAARLLNYENRVVRAGEQIERIKTDKEYGEEGINYIKRLLPGTEQIEFEGREVAVDNTWLHVLLDSYSAEKDPQGRIAHLDEAVGRLRALDDQLRRAEAASGEPGNQNDKIREILSRPAFQPEQETAVGGFVRRVLRKVRGFFGEIGSALQRLIENVLGAGASVGWISNLLVFVVIVAALIVVARMVRRMRAPQRKRKKTRIVLGEEIGADGTAGELADEALTAARAGDFRTAVRKLYVSLLYEFSERGLIELEDSATNREYLSKVSRFNVLVPPMRYLTDRFDYVWYGMFPSTEEEFAAYFSRYKEAMDSARTLAESAKAS